MKYDGIIFDMDGVLVDVTKSYREAIRLTAGYFLRRNVTMDEVSRIKNQPDMNNDWEATYALINDEKIPFNKVKDYFQSLYLGNGKRRGLINVEKLLISKNQLIKIKNIYKKLGIATGRPKFEAEYVISLNQLEGVFDCMVAMEDVEKDKPSPDSIIKVMKILNIQNTVYIGDSPSDVLAAKAAGIPCFYVGNQKLGTKRFPSVGSVINYLL